MSAPTGDEKFERLVQQMDPHSKLLRAWALKGGISARVTALEIEGADGRAKKMVVRQHGAADLQRNPNVAADEFRLLQILHARGLATPAPYYLDQAGEIFATPCVVVEYIDGRTEFAPANLADFIVQMVTHLARLHRLDGSQADPSTTLRTSLSFLPQQEKTYTEKLRARPVRLDESLDEGRIRNALEAVWPLAPHNQPVLLHGDYWPGNILWKDGRLVGVVDWEDAALGDPLADLANSRLELLWTFGGEAMQRFTLHYRSITTVDFTDLPYWDLCAALRPAFKIAAWAGDMSVERKMREGHRWFVAQAFAKLAARG